MEYVKRSFWEIQATKVKFETARKNDLIRQLISRWVSPVSNRSALEIGCVPGRYLSYLGHFGYTLYGIDIIESAIVKMKEWLVSEYHEVGTIISSSLEEYKPQIKFDLVCSFGFIEHFDDYEEIIKKHCDHVAPNGLLIITTPNFYGLIQRFLHLWLDRKNFKRHNINSMNPEIWRKIVEAQGFDIYYSGYFGYFTFWIEEEDERTVFKKYAAKLIIKSLPLMSRLFPKNNKGTSPFCGIVAKRKL